MIFEWISYWSRFQYVSNAPNSHTLMYTNSLILIWTNIQISGQDSITETSQIHSHQNCDVEFPYKKTQKNTWNDKILIFMTLPVPHEDTNYDKENISRYRCSNNNNIIFVLFLMACCLWSRWSSLIIKWRLCFKINS